MGRNGGEDAMEMEARKKNGNVSRREQIIFIIRALRLIRCLLVTLKYRINKVIRKF